MVQGPGFETREEAEAAARRSPVGGHWAVIPAANTIEAGAKARNERQSLETFDVPFNPEALRAFVASLQQPTVLLADVLREMTAPEGVRLLEALQAAGVPLQPRGSAWRRESWSELSRQLWQYDPQAREGMRMQGLSEELLFGPLPAGEVPTVSYGFLLAEEQLTGEQLALHEYPTEEAAAEWASRMLPDASGHRSPWGQVASYGIPAPWIPTRWHRCGRTLVEYHGDDQRVLATVRAQCGPQFAGN